MMLMEERKILLTTENDDHVASFELHTILDIECDTLFVMSKNGPKNISLDVGIQKQSFTDGLGLFADGKTK